MQYGCPYMGSKSKIMPSLAMCFPKANHFYDLFGGGFSVSHYMLVHGSGKFKHIHYNEINTNIVTLVKDAIAGKYNYNVFKPPWISRDEFNQRKETDAYVSLIWSFGNNQNGYLFGEDVEQYKKAMHNAVVFDEFNDIALKVLGFDVWPKNVVTIYHKRSYIRQKIEYHRKHNWYSRELFSSLPAKMLQQLNQSEQLQRLERLQELERLERVNCLELTTSSLSYEQVEILPNSIVYCDIPYNGTAEYLVQFDRKAFLDWAANASFPVYISEYNISDSRFEIVYEIDKRSQLSNTRDTQLVKTENLYWNGRSLTPDA